MPWCVYHRAHCTSIYGPFCKSLIFKFPEAHTGHSQQELLAISELPAHGTTQLACFCPDVPLISTSDEDFPFLEKISVAPQDNLHPCFHFYGLFTSHHPAFRSEPLTPFSVCNPGSMHIIIAPRPCFCSVPVNIGITLKAVMVYWIVQLLQAHGLMQHARQPDWHCPTVCETSKQKCAFQTFLFRSYGT